MISMYISCRNNLIIHKLVTLYIMLNPRYVCSIENNFNDDSDNCFCDRRDI